jgi:TonB family protein
MQRKGALILVVLVCCAVAFAQDEQQLKEALLKRTAVVRGFLVAPDLRFDQQGKVISPANRGFGQLDARVYIDALQLTQDSLVIEGQRTYSEYDPKSQQFRVGLTGEKVRIQIALPPDQPAASAAPDLLKQVFFTTSELQNQCSAEEQAGFQELLTNGWEKPPNGQPANLAVRKHDGSPDAKALAELQRMCFPTGEEAYRADRGVKPPKALKVADPQYSERARAHREEGRTVLLLIIDEKGQPSTIYVTRSLSADLDLAAVRAVQGWTFQPATFQGKPVSVAINVEINFRLTH